MAPLMRIVGAFSIALLTAALADDAPPRSVEDVARASRAAVAVIRSSDRAGGERGAGSGFLLKPEGLLVTNLHVIGEGRGFTAELEDGSVLKPESVIAFDRAGDLAIVAVDKKGLGGLDLGDSEALRPGQTLLAVGNPLGLGLSVVQGTYAQSREVDGRKWLQVAMPIEPGSSGSPLIDLEGKVVGIVAVKSGVSTAFAIPANELRNLLEHRHPMTMSRWLRIGAVDPELWRVLAGGSWRQRTGWIVASGMGAGFGGRTLCLREGPAMGPDFDIAVDVRLEDESGAAGLAFHADGGDRHFGFYPTAGSLRLTRFEGPDVYSWTILRTVSSDHYRPRDWNEVRVRVRGPRLTCMVNGHAVIEVEDAGLLPGKVGLVKFRQPRAEFRRFHVAAELPSPVPSADAAAKAAEIAAKLAQAEEVSPSDASALVELGGEGLRALRDQAAGLERRAARLRAAAEQAAERAALARLKSAVEGKDADVDLLRAALLVSKLDNPDLEIEPYVEIVERLAQRAKVAIAQMEAPEERLRALLEEFTGELGFRGSRLEYYHRSNSYLNDVLDDREGIPITLSVVFIEIARRAGLPVAGVAAPRHFLVRLDRPEGEAVLVDVFGGKVVTHEEAEEVCGGPLAAEDLAPASKGAIVARMLRNLVSVAQREADAPSVLRYLDAVVEIGEAAGPERWMRAVLRARSGDREGAIADLNWILERDAPGVDRAEVEGLIERLRETGDGR
jgi:regulator of sirC expression with transglutaminase-like and TPR domain